VEHPKGYIDGQISIGRHLVEGGGDGRAGGAGGIVSDRVRIRLVGSSSPKGLRRVSRACNS
jgi:hypothetical protein